MLLQLGGPIRGSEQRDYLAIDEKTVLYLLVEKKQCTLKIVPSGTKCIT
jgi:hypothetical protein